jgi:sugar/nucleoside kinase (ribokinase family)
MKTSALILALALTAALPSNAAESSAQTPGIVIDCARPVLPSQEEVSSLTGIENFGQAYAARSRLMEQGLRACKRGAKQVVIVSPSQPRPDAPAVARVDH